MLLAKHHTHTYIISCERGHVLAPDVIRHRAVDELQATFAHMDTGERMSPADEASFAEFGLWFEERERTSALEQAFGFKAMPVCARCARACLAIGESGWFWRFRTPEGWI